MLPYPSGKYIWDMGNYTIGDAIAKYHMMLGKNVLQPMGWDSFGLPAENAAIAHKATPSEWTTSNISNMKKKLKLLGYGYDWNREIQLVMMITINGSNGYLFNYSKRFSIEKSEVNWDPVDKPV